MTISVANQISRYSPIELEGGVASINSDRDWSNSSNSLLKVVFVSFLDVHTALLSGANIRGIKFTPSILKL